MFKKLTTAIMGLVALFSLSSCSLETVRAGNVGVRFNLYGTEKGVQSEVVQPGRYWLSINEEIYPFPLFQQTVMWTADDREESPGDESITFQTIEGLEVNADIAASYMVEEDKVIHLFQKYRRGIDEITDKVLLQHIRDAFSTVASTMKVESVYGEGKSKLLTEVNRIVSESLKADGIIIQKISPIGRFRLPRQVTDSLDAKIAATQDAEKTRNEVEKTKAEAQKAVEVANGEALAIVAKAKAEAEANELIKKSLSPEVVAYQAMMKWDGRLPQVTGGDGATPFITLPNLPTKTAAQ